MARGTSISRILPRVIAVGYVQNYMNNIEVCFGLPAGKDPGIASESFQSGAIIPGQAGRIDSCRLFKCSWPIRKAVNPPLHCLSVVWASPADRTRPAICFVSFSLHLSLRLPLFFFFFFASAYSTRKIFQLLRRSTPSPLLPLRIILHVIITKVEPAAGERERAGERKRETNSLRL